MDTREKNIMQRRNRNDREENFVKEEEIERK